MLRDLQSGKQIKLGVLGGSISWGSAVERGTDDWFALLTAHLAAAFPAANVTGRNGCVPATPSSFMNMCLEQYLDEDVDLVFLEYAVNDGWDTHNVMKRKIYERLLRKVGGCTAYPVGSCSRCSLSWSQTKCSPCCGSYGLKWCQDPHDPTMLFLSASGTSEP